MTHKTGEVVALVGAQTGSEGKGAVAAAIAHKYGVHIRTGGPNAGHTFYHEGKKWVARSIPCGWINPDAKIVIGPGAMVDAALLRQEAEEIEAAGYRILDRLYVDESASLIDPIRHHAFEGGVDGDAHQLIGSTGEGVGPARMARVARRTFPSDIPWAKLDLVGDRRDLFSWLHTHSGWDTANLVNGWLDQGQDVLLEGTQGSELSLTHGPWPYCTSTDTNAGQLAVDAGVSPSLVKKTFLVARTFPIRVAGNSGPMYKETTWEALGLEPEVTTVTKKVRRVGIYDAAAVERAVILNRPAEIVLTFADYIDAKVIGVTDKKKITEPVWDFVDMVEETSGAAVVGIGTGPDSLVWV